ncbi:hypothetical protein HPB52_003465 [Rhipicephalus sanguineus]|uniref:Uncharacterized protein n=1 Tax=Rhipicephalus sanguineus TaxID=34632 RepID=A0A9D4Q8W4_RHISA|nr:hypothetical protein HPB52_003465 [Rhipicephalus sanguineus]
MLLVFERLESVNSALQKKSLQFTRAQHLVKAVEESIGRLRDDFSSFWADVSDEAREHRGPKSFEETGAGTTSFDNTPAAFSNARNEKLAKYEPVAAYLRRRYQRVTVAAVIVGALGSWDPGNDAILRRLSSRSYSRLFKRLCVSEVIAASRAIYHAHVRGGRP